MSPTQSRSRRGRRNFSNNRSKPKHRSGGRPQGRGRGPAKSQIDPRRFVNQAIAPAETEAYIPQHNFDDFPFEPRLKQAIADKGYTLPTAIQDQAIPHVLEGRDLVGLANTGSGKTAAFVLPIIHRLLRHQSQRALIVTPTRELAKQIEDEFRSFARKLHLNAAVCVGGLRENPQIKALRQNPDVVIGTPGRLKDFINQGHLKLGKTDTFVLDEADRMLDMGFVHDMKFLMQHLPAKRQSLCFSATITREIQGIIDQLLHDPVTISVRTSENSDHIEQRVIAADTPADKLEQLQQLLAQPGFGKVLVFGATKHSMQRLSDKLSKAGISAAAIHGNKSQNQRQKALDAFKAGKIQVLVATDVAARGIDVTDVSHVINYDPPNTYEEYIHRIGRTARAGKGGEAITFVPSR